MLLTHRTAHLIFRHRHQAFLRPLSTGPSAVREPGAFSFTGEWASGSGWGHLDLWGMLLYQA